MVHLVEHRTCDREVSSSTGGWAPPSCNCGQVVHTCVPCHHAASFVTGLRVVMSYDWEGKRILPNVVQQVSKGINTSKQSFLAM